MNILETKNLVKKFDGVRAVDTVSIAIEAGKITSIIGPNGSGKSTLINMLTGMVPIDGGMVIVGGKQLSLIRPHEVPQYGIARTFQDVRLFEQMTVADNVLVVITERGVFASLFEKHGARHMALAEQVLRQVGLWEKRNALAENLSYGQRKLLEIARVLALSCTEGFAPITVILLDEPFAGLFKEMIKIVISIIESLRREGKAVVLVEHNMDLIRALSDYVIVMDSGAVLAQGNPVEVLAKKEVIEAYLGE